MKEIPLYAALLLNSVCAAVALVQGGWLPAVLIALFLAFSVVTYKGWYLIEPVIFKHSPIVQVVGRFSLSEERQTAVVKSSGKYLSVAAAHLDVSKGSELSKEKMEGIIRAVGQPFKISLLVHPVDIAKLVNGLKTRQYMAEACLSRLSREKPDYQRSNTIKRELSEIERDLGDLTSGKRPLSVAYLVTTAYSSESRFAAQEGALAGIREIANAFDAGLGFRSKVLAGDELLSALELDSMVVPWA